MSCDKEHLMICQEDFSCIAQVATHCDWDALCPFVRERQNLDLIGLLGNSFYLDVLNNKDDDAYSDLLCGSEYEGCDGSTKMHFGLKRALVHYSYGAYVYRHGFVDTPYNVVQKQIQDSIPVPTDELRKLRREHREMAFSFWEMTLDYLCKNKETFPLFNSCDCSSCCDNCADESFCGECKVCGSIGNPDRTRSFTSTVIKRT